MCEDTFAPRICQRQNHACAKITPTSYCTCQPRITQKGCDARCKQRTHSTHTSGGTQAKRQTLCIQVAAATHKPKHHPSTLIAFACSTAQHRQQYTQIRPQGVQLIAAQRTNARTLQHRNCPQHPNKAMLSDIPSTAVHAAGASCVRCACASACEPARAGRCGARRHA